MPKLINADGSKPSKAKLPTHVFEERPATRSDCEYQQNSKGAHEQGTP